MSVTFTAETRLTDWRLSCSCPDVTGIVFATYSDAAQHFQTHGFDAELLVGCEDPGYCESDLPSILPVLAEEPPSINVSNTNAAVLLDSLGLSSALEGLCGSQPAGEFLGRVLVAVGIHPGDPGRPTETVGNVIDCGRRAGYTEERLEQLRKLASWAVARGCEVRWG